MGLFGNIFGNNLGKVEPHKVIKSDSNYGVVEINEVYNIAGVGVIPVGIVKEGNIRVGQKASFNGKIGTIKSIESNHVKISFASIGQNIGFSLVGVGKEDIVIGSKVHFSNS